jgi:type IV pilus assembly protein PilN
MKLKIGINLSSQPFQRTRPMIAASVLVGVGLLTTLGMLVWLAVFQRGEAAQTRYTVAELDSRMATLAAEQARLEQMLQRPENAAVLQQVLFINSLLYRKGISWTRIFSDLEGVMPYNVRLISIRPQVNAQNQVILDMIVGAQSKEPVIEMLKQMESSPQFGATEVHNWIPPTQSEPLFRYRVSVRYRQQL